jgi:hypothetical protein
MLRLAMNVHRILLLSLPIFPAALAFACGGGNENLPPPPPAPAPAPMTSALPADTGSASASAAPPPAPPPPAPVQLAQGPAAPDPPAPLPAIKILSPSSNQVLPTATAGDTLVKLDVKNWKTAMGDSHIHVILDNKAYKPVYDPTAPLKLSEVPGGDALTEGQHVLVAFPGRATHESVKTKGALSIIQFWVGKKGTATQDLKKPILVYSRPKGEYKGDKANHVLVDFQLINDTLSPTGDHVHVTVTGPGIDTLAADATQFGPPFYLENLQDGSYTVQLDLLGADGKNVPGAWSSVSRKIDISHGQ